MGHRSSSSSQCFDAFGVLTGCCTRLCASASTLLPATGFIEAIGRKRAGPKPLKQASLSAPLCLALALIASALVGTPADAQVTFTRLGALPGSDPATVSSFVTSISGNGRTIVGEEEGYPYMWTAATGMVPSTIGAELLNYDATAAVGNRFSNDPFPHLRAYYWRQSVGGQIVDPLVGDSASTARSVSGNGAVMVGDSGHDSGGYEARRAFRWSEASGIQDLGVLPGTIASRAAACSFDGSVVVGTCSSLALGGPLSVFRWTETTGMTPVTPPSLRAWAVDISADGSIVLGAIDDANISSFLWSQSAGLQIVPNLFNAIAMSGDGSVIINSGQVWTAATGTRNLTDVLAGSAFNPSDWQSLEIVAISDDGRTLAGHGWNVHTAYSESWVATIPAPGAALLLMSGALTLARRRGRITGSLA